MSSNLPNIVPDRLLTSRLYETEYDLRQMQDLLMEARSRTNDWQGAMCGCRGPLAMSATMITRT
jgi:hypothetical protein